MDKNFHSHFESTLDAIVFEALKRQIFSACALGYFFQKQGIVEKKIHTYGRIGPDRLDCILGEKGFFDLASLTKPMVTSLCVLLLLNNGKICLEDRLERFFKNMSFEKKSIKLIHLLTHSSGLPAHRDYFKKLKNFSLNERKRIIIENILNEKLIFEPGNGYLYSDLGYMLLGILIEIVSGENLADFWRKNVIEPMHLEKEFIYAERFRWNKKTVVMTDRNQWNKKKIKCIVNDKNCKIFRGVAGHAGLFGTVGGVLKFLENLLFELTTDEGIFLFSKEIKEKFLKNKEHSSWVYGFDTPSCGYSSSGKYFSNVSYGHLGFTGTSFWIDIINECGVVLLTNRVLFENSLNEIRKLRPIIHDVVMKHILIMKGVG